MDASITAKLGILFGVLGLAATFLMYHLWGYPFDKETRTSAAPRWAMYTHRGIGYAFALIYVILMWKMVPRMWEYQVEFPARTTAHIIIGFTIGFLLVIKIAIMRFFRHFEEWMPYLGTAIMLGTVLLLGLSIPFVFRERALAARADVYSAESRARIERLLPLAGLPKEAPLAELASASGLRKGRRVLLSNCVRCHDLKTVLEKPRSPQGWWRTVERMSEKPALFDPIEPAEQWHVTAYLIGITPPLQRAQKMLRERDEQHLAALTASKSPAPAQPGGDAGAPAQAAVDPAKAKATFERVCSQCHDTSDVDDEPPKSAAETDAIIKRMIEDNEMEAKEEEIRLIRWYLNAHYVEKKL